MEHDNRVLVPLIVPQPESDMEAVCSALDDGGDEVDRQAEQSGLDVGQLHPDVKLKDGRFQLSLNPQIYDVICEMYATGTARKEIQSLVKKTWGVEIPIGTINYLDRVPRYHRLISKYRKHIGPALRKIPQVNIVNRAQVLSDIIENKDSDDRVKIMAIAAMQKELDSPNTQKLLEEADDNETPVKDKIILTIRASIMILKSNYRAFIHEDYYNDIMKQMEKIVDQWRKENQREALPCVKN